MHYGTNSPYYYSQERAGNPQTVTVDGHGMVKAKPDIVVLTLGVITENENVKAAQQENALRTNSVIAALKALGIDEKNIETTSYTMSPQYEYVDGKPQSRGYRVEHMLEVTVLNVQQAGQVYDEAVQNGANIARSLVFKVSNPSSYENEALTLAVKNAQEKAKVIAGALGVSINPVPANIKEEQTNVQREYVAAFSSMSTESATPIQTGDLDVSATIRAVFQYM
ncbi:SIMPL domain-containing protein [Bacillus sp. 165]|uniref:SIMPL domain-containing protein n=1 Tax=Bacillus sp. 165 TaxID=1529117 RepID=UPI001ADB91E5|nr:SIMPL domain-containing protein [Bacillus sp. 165]MBO9129812.1 SIMPL domain-containing protein [Bacillus sp. 165]